MKQNKLENLFETFMEEQRFVAKRAEETLRGYRSGFALFMKLMSGSTLKDLTSDTITEFFRKLETRERVCGRTVRKGIKASTIATHRSKLNCFSQWLIAKGHLKKSPFDGIPYPDPNYEDLRWLRQADIEKIITGIALKSHNRFIGERNKLIILLALYLGLRKNEMLNIKIYDLDMERKILTVRAETSKSKRERSLPLSKEITKSLNSYLAERKSLSYHNPYLIVSENRDNKLSKDGFKHVIEKIKKDSGVEFHFHQLRHTFAVNMLAKNCDTAKLKQLMGHKDIRMTAAYLRCLPAEILRPDMDKLSIDKLV